MKTEYPTPPHLGPDGTWGLVLGPVFSLMCIVLIAGDPTTWSGWVGLLVGVTFTAGGLLLLDVNKTRTEEYLSALHEVDPKAATELRDHLRGGGRLSDRKTAVYQIRDAGGRLVYIGMTDNPERRMRQHSEKWWWPREPQVTVDWYGSRNEAKSVETKMIGLLKPPQNKQGV